MSGAEQGYHPLLSPQPGEVHPVSGDARAKAVFPPGHRILAPELGFHFQDGMVARKATRRVEPDLLLDAAFLLGVTKRALVNLTVRAGRPNTVALLVNAEAALADVLVDLCYPLEELAEAQEWTRQEEAAVEGRAQPMDGAE